MKKQKTWLEPEIPKTALIPGLNSGVFNRAVLGITQNHQVILGDHKFRREFMIKNCALKGAILDPAQFLIKMAGPIDLRTANTSLIIEKLENDIKLREMGFAAKAEPNRKL